MHVILALAVTVSSFNLNCTGTQVLDTWTGMKRETVSKQDVSITFRVNLAEGLWCSGRCAATSRIAAVDDAKIVFHREEEESGDEFTMVNRRTGALTQRDRVFLGKDM